MILFIILQWTQRFEQGFAKFLRKRVSANATIAMTPLAVDAFVLSRILNDKPLLIENDDSSVQTVAQDTDRADINELHGMHIRQLMPKKLTNNFEK